MEQLKAQEGDILYMSDSRWWLGGLRSYHVKAKVQVGLEDNQVKMSNLTHKEAYLLGNKPLVIEKII